MSSGKISITIAVAAASIAIAALAVSLYSSQSENRSTISSDGINDEVIRLVAADIGNRIDESISVMRLTSHMEQVRSTDYVNSIDVAQMGIPEDQDIEKRQVAKEILSEHQEFASIFFLTPSGDIYIGEPFEQQVQLPRLNYADRDWYKGASSTKDAYVSAVFMSAAIHVPAIAIAVPVYSTQADDQISGYWVAIVNVADIGSALKNIETADSRSRILLVDHNGTEVADTSRTSQETELRSFVGLGSIKSVLSGETGARVEEIDGAEMVATFTPVRAYPHLWGMVFLEPSNGAQND